jgi:uncharacterized RDD family membrane protein YckC
LIPDHETEWDQLSIETPELVDIAMPVAGIGSRFVALLVDYLIWLAVAILVAIVIAVVDPSLSHFSKVGEKWAVALFIFVPFLVYWGYFTLFEAFWHGQTPGKRVAKIRVIQRTGRGIGLFESMTRNFLRIVDQVPGVYMVGAVSIFLTKQHQRLGDLAAGTIVVHERERLEESNAASTHRSFTAGLFDQQAIAPAPRAAALELPTVPLQRLGVADLEVLEGFFARRLDFTLETRATLAQRIAASLYAKSGLLIPPGVEIETFLEEVAHQLRDLVRIR